MTIDEFRNALGILLTDAARSGLPVPDIIKVTEKELHPPVDDTDAMGHLIRRYTSEM